MKAADRLKRDRNETLERLFAGKIVREMAVAELVITGLEPVQAEWLIDNHKEARK